MKDVSEALRTAYASVLDGKIIYNGVPVQAYGRTIPVDAVYPLISIPNQFGFNTSSKDCFSTTETVDIDIIARSANGGNGSAVDKIASQVMQIIGKMNQADYPEIDSEFFISEIRFDSHRSLTERDLTYIYDRKVVSFTNDIQQL